MSRPVKARRGLAMMVALFLMVVISTIVVSTLDTTMLQYAANRNTLAWDQARYLAEAGAQHALALLEADNTWRTGIASTQFPAGSGNTYRLGGPAGPAVTLRRTGGRYGLATMCIVVGQGIAMVVEAG